MIGGMRVRGFQVEEICLGFMRQGRGFMAEVCRRMVLLRPGIQSFVAQGISLEALKVLDHIITVNA